MLILISSTVRDNFSTRANKNDSRIASDEWNRKRLSRIGPPIVIEEGRVLPLSQSFARVTDRKVQKTIAAPATFRIQVIDAIEAKTEQTGTLDRKNSFQ